MMRIAMINVMRVGVLMLVDFAWFADGHPHGHCADQHKRDNGDAAPQNRRQPGLTERRLELRTEEKKSIWNRPHGDRHTSKRSADTDGAKLLDEVVAVFC